MEFKFCSRPLLYVRYFEPGDRLNMNKQIIISFAETSDNEVDVNLESTDPSDDINDIIALLHSTLQSLASGLSDEEVWDTEGS